MIIAKNDVFKTNESFNRRLLQVLKPQAGNGQGVTDWLVEPIKKAHQLGWTLAPEALALLGKCLENNPDLGLESVYFEMKTAQNQDPTKEESKNPLDGLKRSFDAFAARKYAVKFQNAAKRGIDFDLSFTDMKKLLKQKKCFYTGVDLVFGEDENGNTQPNQWTLDRVDNNIGYTKQNTVVCSHIANQWKCKAIESPEIKLPFDQILAVVTKMNSLIGEKK
jgi:hypothetical protein